MSTFAEMVDDTIMQLYGFTTRQDTETYLTAGITDSDTTLSVSSAAGFGRGLVQVGDELMRVNTVDVNGGTITITPTGRGYRSTTAQAHAMNAPVVYSPMFPRVQVKKALNDTILAVFPRLYAVTNTKIPFTPPTAQYELPAGTTGVIDVRLETLGGSGRWADAKRWELNLNSDKTAFPSGVSLIVGDAPYAGGSILVTTRSKPTQLSAPTDDFSTVTGLPESTEDVVRLGAIWRMSALLDVAQVTGQSAEAGYQGQYRPRSESIGKWAYQNFLARLEEEANSLNTLNPVRPHYTLR